MKTLIAEDDFTSRLLMQELLKVYGPTDVVVDGREAVKAFQSAWEAGNPYQLVCLDIMMPALDGQQALRAIRDIEEERGIFSSDGAKILMTTALDDMQNKIKAFSGLCDGYMVKPINKEKLIIELRKHGLIP